MRQVQVLYKKEAAGVLTQLDNGSFVFKYYDQWFNNSDKPAISLTLPKTHQEYTSKYLFPFFYNMLPEGSNKQVVCFENRIDAKDYFSILMVTAMHDTIGAITIKAVNK